MKNNYVIMSDNMGDLPQSFYEEHQIPVMYLSYVMKDEVYPQLQVKIIHLSYAQRTTIFQVVLLLLPQILYIAVH